MCRSPKGVRAPAELKGTCMVLEHTVLLAHSQALRLHHFLGSPSGINNMVLGMHALKSVHSKNLLMAKTYICSVS